MMMIIVTMMIIATMMIIVTMMMVIMMIVIMIMAHPPLWGLPATTVVEVEEPPSFYNNHVSTSEAYFHKERDILNVSKFIHCLLWWLDLILTVCNVWKADFTLMIAIFVFEPPVWKQPPEADLGLMNRSCRLLVGCTQGKLYGRADKNAIYNQTKVFFISPLL